ncbi:MAG TPA: Ig-like domain-containing protein [Iamia sp.]|nr:Ig-like domain-containing protein [Iamia sp.]
MRGTLKAIAGLCFLTGTLFFASSSAPVSAQECGGYSGNPCVEEEVLEVEYPSCVVANDPFAVTGSVTPPDAASAGEDIAFDIDGQSAGTLAIADDGSISGSLTTPNLALGNYTFTAVTGELEASGPIEVCTDPNVGSNNNNVTGNTPLARTGFDATPVVTLGAAALVLGAAAVYGSKRRRVA